MHQTSTKKYQTGHDWEGNVINRELCKRLKFDNTTKWYMHQPEFVIAKKTRQILGDFEIQTDHRILQDKT